MDELEAKLNSILGNPEMMGKIMSMASALGSQEGQTGEPPSQEAMPDLGMLKNLAGMAKQSGIDSQQQNLIQALHPYLSGQRIRKLENAMRAAKMAKLAASALGTQGGKFFPGR